MAVADKVPEQYICPISGDIMSDPYTTPCNHTFEASAIIFWRDVQNKDRCPCCTGGLKGEFSDNDSLKTEIEEFIHDNPELVKEYQNSLKRHAKSRKLRM